MTSDKKTNELPIITRRTLTSSGDSTVIAIPTEWLKQRGLQRGDSVILIANGNLTVHKDEPEICKKLSEQLKVEELR